MKTKHGTTNYRTLKPFIDVVKRNDGHMRFTAEGFMDLSIEDLFRKDRFGNDVFAIAHYGEQNGDAMADPDMEFSIDETNKRIIPRTFQNDYIGLYQQVFRNGDATYSPRLLIDLDEFLWQWLKNIEMQGFKPE